MFSAVAKQIPGSLQKASKRGIRKRWTNGGVHCIFDPTFVSNSVEAGTYIFQLPELHVFYASRLKQLGFSKSFNKTRLRQQFLEHFMEAKEETDGKKVLLVFREGMKEILKDAVKERDFSEDALILVKAAKILRKNVFNHQPFKFDNEFPPHCQEELFAHYS